MTRWTASDIPSQRGRTAVVTGTGGLGFEGALELARAGGDVIVAGRNPRKGADAAAKIRDLAPQVTISFERLDLASLASIAKFADRLSSKRRSIDILVNNAGVMVPPRREETEDGFELQFGTNFLGHFALTAHLLPLLRNGRQPRIVTVSSIAARGGSINFDDLNAERDYKPMPVYSQSKLACLIFAIELARRSERNGWGVSSIAVHPGVSRTDLLLNASGKFSLQRIVRTLLPFMFQPAAQGALPTLYAATAPDAKPGAYYGPDKMSETRGHPAEAKIPAAALDGAAAAHLWQRAETLTGISFPGAMIEQDSIPL
ncbi:MAG: short chain dehydrogenase [Rhodobacteraceae bacterium]|uniref:SDR family oxidoreductase n=1 Tax=uncultured Sphingobium sp. TaxID=316087 RepID=UPI000C3EBD70|nr:SDR family oxidoreductase [uncultured Sphingobium sp.]MAM37686.1 short chain dehydrogenase [Erythrobacter sp.]MAY44098.1 short chain dehydrogenase [Paracoccaceae bacterium]|tara:strand:- start:8918 stop:9865 length:948 start_codon:yes stop_codon:yes gene_type:complete